MAIRAKLLLVAATRPNFTKVAPVMRAVAAGRIVTAIAERVEQRVSGCAGERAST